MLDILHKTLQVFRTRIHCLLYKCHHGDPVFEELIYSHIEDGWRYCPPLGHPAIPLEGGDNIYAGLCHCLQSDPVLTEEVEGPRAQSIRRQDSEAAVTAQGVIGFMNI